MARIVALTRIVDGRCSGYIGKYSKRSALDIRRPEGKTGADGTGPFSSEIPAGYGGRTTAMGYFASPDAMNPKFTGQVRDNETGIDFFNARYLSGAQGRFQSVDPGNAGANAVDPQSWNAYAYVGNNPLTYTDPSGMVESAGGDGIGSIGSAIVIGFIDLGQLIAGFFGGGPPPPPVPPPAAPPAGTPTDFGVSFGPFGPDMSSGPTASDVLPYIIPGLVFQVQGIGRYPVDTRNLITKARANLSKTCDVKFGAVIPTYTNTAFFNSLLSAQIQYPPGTRDIPTNRVYGADADTLIREPGAAIRLFPNFYGLSATEQGFTLVHEGLHYFTRWDDPTIFQRFRSRGLRQVNPGTHDITTWIQGGCKQ